MTFKWQDRRRVWRAYFLARRQNSRLGRRNYRLYLIFSLRTGVDYRGERNLLDSAVCRTVGPRLSLRERDGYFVLFLASLEFLHDYKKIVLLSLQTPLYWSLAVDCCGHYVCDLETRFESIGCLHSPNFGLSRMRVSPLCFFVWTWLERAQTGTWTLLLDSTQVRRDCCRLWNWPHYSCRQTNLFELVGLYHFFMCLVILSRFQLFLRSIRRWAAPRLFHSPGKLVLLVFAKMYYYWMDLVRARLKEDLFSVGPTSLTILQSIP